MKIRTRAKGFTLVEAILVIVIIGVIAGIVSVFIRVPILGYRDAVDRAEITDQADLALRRIARDVRLALPNSVRVLNGSALEFLQTKTGGRYLSVDDGLPALPALDDPAQTSFTVLAPPAMFNTVVAGDRVVVYNLGEGMAPSDAYSGANTAVIDAAPKAGSDTPFGPIVIVPLRSNPFAAQAAAGLPVMTSPTNSFQVIGGAVSFVCTDQGDGTFTLWRVWGYGITASQTVPTGPNRAIVAARLTGCNNIFRYDTAAIQRSGLVLVSLELRGRYPDSPPVRLVHQIHVDNTP